MGSKIIAALGVMIGASVAVAACTPGELGSRAPSRHDKAVAAAAHKRYLALRHAKVPKAGQRFGPACAHLPKTGPGSAADLARLPVTTGLGRIRQLAVLDRAIQQTGLASKLDSTQPLTLFAPVNAAFTTIGTSTLRVLMATKTDLTRVVTFHAVAARVTPADLARHHKVTTLGGTQIVPAGSGLLLGVNNASVICGNLRTAHATVYIVDRVIIPAG